MEAEIAALVEAEQTLASAAAAITAGSGFAWESDEHIVRLASTLGAIKRRVEGLLVEATAELEARCGARADGQVSVDHRYGCKDVRELIARCTGDAGATVGKYLAAGRLVRGGTTLHGEALEPFLPALRQVLRDGRVGVDGLLAAGKPLDAVRSRVHPDLVAATDAYLADRITGMPDGLLPADALRQEATDIAAALDEDGPEPTEAERAAQRAFRFGRATQGLVPVHGMLLPEVAAGMKHLFAAITHPRVVFRDTEAFATDPEQRTGAQRDHDALATIVTVAAASGANEIPNVNGSAPTLVVHVQESDLLNRTGSAFVNNADADAARLPVPVGVASHTACTANVLRMVTDGRGRPVGLSTLSRCYTGAQYLAIAARDQVCVIPGCEVPAVWCETHHVVPYAKGGRTSVDNGVLLCWHHHRTIDTAGWAIQMRDGIPWILPPEWIDPHRVWREHRPPLADRRI